MSAIRSLADLEKEEILKAILALGNIPKAARALKISRRTIYRKLERYGIARQTNEILAELKRQQPLKLR